MITESMVYWITRLDNIGLFLGLLNIPFIFLSILFGIFWLENNYDWAKKWFLLVLALFIIDILTLVFLPSTRDMVYIKVLPKVSDPAFLESPNVQKIIDVIKN